VRGNIRSFLPATGSVIKPSTKVYTDGVGDRRADMDRDSPTRLTIQKIILTKYSRLVKDLRNAGELLREGQNSWRFKCQAHDYLDYLFVLLSSFMILIRKTENLINIIKIVAHLIIRIIKVSPGMKIIDAKETNHMNIQSK